MTEMLGVLSEMSQEALPNDGPSVFTFRPWNPREESWDDFRGAVQRAYAQYVDGCRRTSTADQPGHDPAPAEPDPDGSD